MSICALAMCITIVRWQHILNLVSIHDTIFLEVYSFGAHVSPLLIADSQFYIRLWTESLFNLNKCIFTLVTAHWFFTMDFHDIFVTLEWPVYPSFSRQFPNTDHLFIPPVNSLQQMTCVTEKSSIGSHKMKG